jgi:ABC-2 type transport system permease protein
MSNVGSVYILWLRQLKRYQRSPARIAGSLGQPLLFLLALGFGFGPIFQKAGGGDYLQFLVPGIIAMSILFTSVFTGVEIIWDRQFGFLKETLVAPVPRLTIMIGRTLGGATIAVFQGIVVLLLGTIIGFRFNPVMLLPAIAFMLLIALLFTALGTAIGSVLEDMQGFQLIMNFLLMPLFFLSGALFPLSGGLPEALTLIASLNPLSYGVDGLRSVLINMTHFSLAADFGVLIGVTAIFLVIGSYLFSKIQI